MEGLTPRQEQVLEFIRESVRANGYPPTVREICAGLDLSSPSTVHAHLANLERLGLIKRDPTKPRALDVVQDLRPPRPLPLVGRVAAGAPILAEDNIEELVDVPGFLRRDDGDFVLRVRGDSMIGAGIFDADLIVVHPLPEARDGEIVVARVAASATTRRPPSASTATGRGAARSRERELRADHRQRRPGGTRRPSRGGPSPAMSTMPLATAVQQTLADAVDESLAAALAGRDVSCLWCGGHAVVLAADIWSGAVTISCRTAAARSAASCRVTCGRCPGERARPPARRRRHPGRAPVGDAGLAVAGQGGRRQRRRRRVAGLVRFAVFLLLIFIAVWAGVRVAHAGVDGADLHRSALHGAVGRRPVDHRRYPVRRRPRPAQGRVRHQGGQPPRGRVTPARPGSHAAVPRRLARRASGLARRPWGILAPRPGRGAAW